MPIPHQAAAHAAAQPERITLRLVFGRACPWAVCIAGEPASYHRTYAGAAYAAFGPAITAAENDYVTREAAALGVVQ